MHDWPLPAEAGIPTPDLVAAWLTLDVLPTERVPLWAAHWLADGFDGDNLAELAGLHGDDPRAVRDVLVAALADCGAAPPAADDAAAMIVFCAIATLYVTQLAADRWVTAKVDEVVARSGYSTSVIELPLGQLYTLDDEWDNGCGRPANDIRKLVADACAAQLAAAAPR
jgi:hypothetical protein